jgi:hypothetical protein
MSIPTVCYEFLLIIGQADFGVEPLIGVSKGGEHPLCKFLNWQRDSNPAREIN